MELEMNKETVELIIFLITVVTKFGAPVVKNFISMLNKNEITKEDLINLMLEKDPESFFR